MAMEKTDILELRKRWLYDIAAILQDELSPDARERLRTLTIIAESDAIAEEETDPLERRTYRNPES